MATACTITATAATSTTITDPVFHGCAIIGTENINR